MTVVTTVLPSAVKRIVTVDQHSYALQHSLDFDKERTYRIPQTTEQRETPGRNKSPENRLPREMSGTTRIERKVRDLSKLATKSNFVLEKLGSGRLQIC